jgi:hypothetical protein
MTMGPIKFQPLISIFGPIVCVLTSTLWIIPANGFAGFPDASTIIQRSVQARRSDWQMAPRFNYSERDVVDQGTRTYHVMMILGSPYQRLIAINQQPISASEREKEQRKLDQVIAARRKESNVQRKNRIADFQKERQRDNRLSEELTKAFDFRVTGEETVNNHLTYTLLATPKPTYRPVDEETKVLTGMRGKLWIDKATFEWVKVEAEVIHPVSIAGFLAKVNPGTQFELERAPVARGIWLPTHFSARSKAKILSIIGHHTQTDESYFGYRMADSTAQRISDADGSNK